MNSFLGIDNVILSTSLLFPLIILTPPYQYFMTFLHEMGHYINLCFICLIYKNRIEKPQFKIRTVKFSILTFYKGLTINKTYQFLIQNKKPEPKSFSVPLRDKSIFSKASPVP